MNAKTLYTVDQTMGQYAQYGNRFEFRADWGSATTYDTEAEAVAAYYRDVYDALPRAWKVENDCSNGRFAMRGGLVAGKIEREVWELDEDGELCDLVASEVITFDIWDGAEGMWVEFY